jgi:hypothetical protein
VPPHPLLAHVAEPPGPMTLIIPPLGARHLAAGDEVSFGVRLFDCMLSPEPIERALENIAALPFGRESGRGRLKTLTRHRPTEHQISPAGNCDASVTVHFETPVRMKREGRPAQEIDFPTLFSQLWRRLTMLCALYGEYSPADDDGFRILHKMAPSVRATDCRLRPLRWDHFSSATSEVKPMRGLIGHVSFEVTARSRPS